MASTGNASTKFQPGNQLAAGHGAPLGNANAFKHGKRSRRALTIGKLPQSCNWISNRVSTLRRELERAVADAHGDISLKHSLFINSALRHEQAALLAQRYLRLHGDTMSHGERLSYLQAVAAESDKRDKAVDRLNLDRDGATILEALYAPRITDAEGGDDGSK